MLSVTETTCPISSRSQERELGCLLLGLCLSNSGSLPSSPRPTLLAGSPHAIRMEELLCHLESRVGGTQGRGCLRPCSGPVFVHQWLLLLKAHPHLVLKLGAHRFLFRAFCSHLEENKNVSGSFLPRCGVHRPLEPGSTGKLGEPCPWGPAGPEGSSTAPGKPRGHAVRPSTGVSISALSQGCGHLRDPRFPNSHYLPLVSLLWPAGQSFLPFQTNKWVLFLLYYIWINLMPSSFRHELLIFQMEDFRIQISFSLPRARPLQLNTVMFEIIIICGCSGGREFIGKGLLDAGMLEGREGVKAIPRKNKQ